MLRLLPLALLGAAAFGVSKLLTEEEKPVRPAATEFTGQKYDANGFYTTEYLNHVRGHAKPQDPPVKPL